MWFVYVIETTKGRYYTGVAKDVNKRFSQHLGILKGGAKFFRSDKPELLVYCRRCESRSTAQKVEASIKQLDRSAKEFLIFSC